MSLAQALLASTVILAILGGNAAESYGRAARRRRFRERASPPPSAIPEVWGRLTRVTGGLTGVPPGCLSPDDTLDSLDDLGLDVRKDLFPALMREFGMSIPFEGPMQTLGSVAGAVAQGLAEPRPFPTRGYLGGFRYALLGDDGDDSLFTLAHLGAVVGGFVGWAAGHPFALAAVGAVVGAHAVAIRVSNDPKPPPWPEQRP